jgi:hypothetical protein
MTSTWRILLLVLGAAAVASAALLWVGRAPDGTSSRPSGPEAGFSSKRVGTSALSHGGPTPGRRGGEPPRAGAEQDGGQPGQ